MTPWVYTIPTGLVVVAYGLFQALRPESWWRLTTAWRVWDSRSGPSDAYLLVTKVGGWVFVGLGVWLATTPLYLR